ncbi:carbamoyl-phosphate synthase large subunit [Arcanobacterium pluranimalium]|uniref:carbamoyl-phosphate synthase large subunit n=1 Tax=Arcanobacterium pluranimalium TaxID=108028 RepID=UPI00195A26E1|nr:carbamoyl-phosphate synthase large subunit [Arcanobacterium pluranimalium]MBM7825481.1 carbamoyl-phosphate synthase large subunit [Arcanobacterium pluranimalium]
MPRRADLKTILLIGAGPIVIGQACEFDYSGAQACKALREEGYRIVLVNSNPATIMTDPDVADATYIEPIEWRTLEKVIARERPDAILPTMGGQTALNCALELAQRGILARYNVELIGASEEAIAKAEDRGKFKEAMRNIGLNTPKSFVCHTLDEAMQAQQAVGFPTLIRPSFTMGGSGGGIAYNRDEFTDICLRGFEESPTHELLIEQSILGWKEFEMEVVRDRMDNCIIVCSIENFDPCGIHTGDSITVAPAQTLTDKEYQLLRNASIAVLQEIGVDTGGSNVQFAVHPSTGEIIVIEMNPRVSRSSALASKATGFPIAKVAAKLAVGYTLDELQNDITGGSTPISFEPALDYVVTKVPRFAFEKFPAADPHLTTQMKSVGEVMAIGRTFQESLQKALCGLEVGLSGFDPQTTHGSSTSTQVNLIKQELSVPKAERILFIADAYRAGMSIEEIHALTSIDPWFLAQIAEIVAIENQLSTLSLEQLTPDTLFTAKQKGFSDTRLAALLAVSPDDVRRRRQELNVTPVFKRVDTCAGEFASETAYLYSTYEEECEADPTQQRKIMILGGGPNRIGQGIEFDYCCVHASLALRQAGYETIMVNCNPETVSTDYDTSDKLYFEPLTLEKVLDIVDVEQPDGVIVHYGGQTPLKLARALEEHGVRIVGTSAEAIDIAEDRERFQKIVAKCGLLQPENRIARSVGEAITMAHDVGYPLMVRPSYVLGGRAMQVVYDDDQLRRYMGKAVDVSPQNPVLLDSFLSHAIEVDVDCISDGSDVMIAGIMEHVEQAGVHSGDSTCSLPPHSLSQAIQEEIRLQTAKLAQELGVIGLMNVQFAVQDGEIYVLEVNPRASRTVPFVSKATGRQIAKIAALVMVGKTLSELNNTGEATPKVWSVKAPVFPFTKFPGVDTILGPEMRSTGEVMASGASFAQAYYKAQIGTGGSVPRVGKAFLSVQDKDKPGIVDIARRLQVLGFGLCATQGTAQYLAKHGVHVQIMNRRTEARPHIIDAMTNGEISLVVNTGNSEGQVVADGAKIRQKALAMRIPIYTTIAGGKAITSAIAHSEDDAVVELHEIN